LPSHGHGRTAFDGDPKQEPPTAPSKERSPQNPSFAGAKFAYPFVSDLVTAAFMKLGAGVREAMLVQNVSWAFSLLVVLERFVFRLANDRLAARLAPPLLFFSGGLGFLWFFSDYAAQSKSFFEFLNAIGKDYTIGNEFRWGNSMITLFITQRSILLGMPLAIVVLTGLWTIFTREPQRHKVNASTAYVRPAMIGLVAGLLPLVHLHSLFVLFVVTGSLFVIRPALWKAWIAFGIGVCVIAVPELVWSITGSATNASEFLAFHFGWDSRDNNFIWFWIKNTGIFIPLIVFGIYLVLSRTGSSDVEPKRTTKKKSGAGSTQFSSSDVVLFYAPFAFLFVLANVAKLAPWEWDNIKVLVYWFVGSLAFVATGVAWLWRKDTALKIAAALIFASLIASGGLDVWRTVSRQINYRVFDPDAVTIANRIKLVTPPNALFLNAPTYNSAVVLSGRRSLMRYPGHLASHGIDYKMREADLKQMYRGGQLAIELMKNYGIEYVLISPEERNSVSPNESFFASFTVVTEIGQYKVYDVRQKHER